MAAITWNHVVALYDDLDCVNTEAQEIYLAEANTAIDVSNFEGGELSPRVKLARIYLAAHGAYAAKLRGDGPVASESIGGVSTSYRAVGSDDNALRLTAPGREYLSIIDTSLCRLPVVC